MSVFANLVACEWFGSALNSAESSGYLIADIVCTDDHIGPSRYGFVVVAVAAFGEKNAIRTISKSAIISKASCFFGFHLCFDFSLIEQVAI